MKILAVTNMYPSRTSPSQGAFVQEQVKGLHEVGLDVRVLFADRRRDGPIIYYRLGKKLRDIVAEFNPDVIHVMYGGVMADQIARRHHVRPVVVTFRGSDLLGENLSGWVRKAISRYGVFCSKRAARAADGVVVVAPHLLRALNGVVPADKVRVIPSGINLDRFTPMDQEPCRKELGWSAGTFHVLFASNNKDPVKRPWLAKEAVVKINTAAQPAELHVLSNIPAEEVPAWMNASDALLMTSLHEGSPNVVKEALACGLPVVSVDVGDVAERLKGIEGCFLALAEPADLAAKLSLVRQRAKRLACRKLLKDFSLLNVSGKLNEFYHQIVYSRGEEVSPQAKSNDDSNETGRDANPPALFERQFQMAAWNGSAYGTAGSMRSSNRELNERAGH